MFRYYVKPLCLVQFACFAALAGRVWSAEIYWSTLQDGIYRARLDGSDVEQVVSGTNVDHGTTLVFNDATQTLFWGATAEWSGLSPKIQSLNFQTGEIQEIQVDHSSPWDLQIDPDNEKLYWVAGGGPARKHFVYRSDLDGSNIEELISYIQDSKRVTALDLDADFVYWGGAADVEGQDERVYQIGRSKLDGNDIEPLFDLHAGIQDVSGIEIDDRARQLYWIDVGSDRIFRANMDGTGLEVLVEGLHNPTDLALDLTANRMYWVERSWVDRSGIVSRAHLDGSDVQVIANAKGDPSGIIIVGNSPAAGDFDEDGVLDVDDIDLLATAIREGGRDLAFDVDLNGTVSSNDLRVWITDLANTFFGDANLDGEFNSGDLVNVFTAANYETGDTAEWAEGDWTGDGVFSSRDLVLAFQDGGYEQGPRVAVSSVPEPSFSLVLIGAASMLIRCRAFVQHGHHEARSARAY